MIPVTVFQGRKIAVFGLGLSGLPAARSLLAGGAEIIAWDDSETARVAGSAENIPLRDLKSEAWGDFAALVLAIVGGLFVLEAASVIVQVASFRLTGKRVFRMAPLHHHFEQKGWPESTVVIRFWIIAVVLALAGLATLKLR